MRLIRSIRECTTGIAMLGWCLTMAWGQAPAEFTVHGRRLDPEGRQSRQAPIRAGWERWSENLLFSPDLVGRWTHRDRDDAWQGLYAAGLDIRKTLANQRRDVATLMLQPYVVHREDLFMIPNHVESRNDWEGELHQVWINWHADARGRARLRAGHFLIPYGLEPLTDTHFTLRQLISGPNLGSKMDWGVSLNGELPEWDYEVALLRGSGMEYAVADGNDAVAGRLGTRKDRNWVIGISGYHGSPIDRGRSRRYRSAGGLRRLESNQIRRWRTGIDVSLILGPFTLLHETSYGQDFDQEVLNLLQEIAWQSRRESFKLYLQGSWLRQHAASGWDGDMRLTGGAGWQLNDDWSLDAQIRQDLDRLGNPRRDTLLSLQIRAHF